MHIREEAGDCLLFRPKNSNLVIKGLIEGFCLKNRELFQLIYKLNSIFRTLTIYQDERINFHCNSSYSVILIISSISKGRNKNTKLNFITIRSLEEIKEEKIKIEIVELN